MSTDAASTASCPYPAVTNHARDRWIMRICSTRDGVAPWDLVPSFFAAVSVGVPRNEGHGRLHPPTGALFVYKTNPRDWIVVTVLDTACHRVTIVDDHLKRCDECNLRFDPGRGDCPWHPHSSERHDG